LKINKNSLDFYLKYKVGMSIILNMQKKRRKYYEKEKGTQKKERIKLKGSLLGI